MMHPIFFSFANDAAELANRVRSKFNDDLIYAYTRTGGVADAFPLEIQQELTACSIFVVFWSKKYVENDPARVWCRRELLTASKRATQGTLSRYFIVQVDHTPLDHQIIDPETGEQIDAMKAFRQESRAFSAPVSANVIEQRLSMELAQLNQSNHPIMARENLERQLREVLDTGSMSSKTPVVFVNGFHGSGRRTLIRSVMDGQRHLTPYFVALDGIEGPEDLLRNIWGDVLHKSLNEQRNMLRHIEETPTAVLGYFRQLGLQLVVNKSYLVITKDDSTDLNEVAPRWLPECLSQVQPAVQPLIFCTLRRPLPDFMRIILRNGADVDVPTLEDDESLRMAHLLIGAVDPTRTARWAPHIQTIVEASASNPKLLLDIVRTASRRPNFDFLSRDIHGDVQRFDEHVQRAIEWAWDSIKDNRLAVQVLDVINLLGATHIDSLRDIFDGSQTEMGDGLYHLIQCGLVEHLSESIYRIPRALSRKLNLYVAGALPRSSTYKLLKAYVNRRDFVEGSSALAMTNRLQVQLSTDSPIPDEDLVFITAAMLFKAGWQRYRLGQYAAALPLLRRAFEKIERVQDESSRLEIVRYYGQSAAKELSSKDVEAATAFLNRPGNFKHRLDKVKAISLFLQAFAKKSKSQFQEALPLYLHALEELPENAAHGALRSQMLNEAAQCVLRIDPLNARLAVSLAEESCEIRGTANSYDVLLRSLLAQTYLDDTATAEEISANIEAIPHWEKLLEEKCLVGNLSFYHSRVIDRLEAEAIDAVLASEAPFPSLDLSEAITMCKAAFEKFDEDALQWKLWDLRLADEVNRNWSELHHEVTRYLASPGHSKMGRGNAARIMILTIDTTTPSGRQSAISELNKYKMDSVFPIAVSKDIRRSIDNGIHERMRLVSPAQKISAIALQQSWGNDNGEHRRN